MTVSPEIQPNPPAPEGVTEAVQTPEIPQHIEKGGVKAVQTNFTSTVYDDQSQALIQTPQTKTVTIKIPTDQNQLIGWAKGGVGDSLTWYALFWLRLIKKAIRSGWKVIVEGVK